MSHHHQKNCKHSNCIFNIVKGPIGPTGAPGPQGPTGLNGLDGHSGSTGPHGPTGPTGDKGEPGQSSNTGSTGPLGPTGPTGEKGEPGESLNTGSTGPTGPIGETGPTGATTLAELRDVEYGSQCSTVAGIKNGNILQYDGLKWTNRPGLYNNIMMHFETSTELDTKIPRYQRLTQAEPPFTLLPSQGILIYYFDNNVEESIFTLQVLPFNYKPNTPIYIRLHCTPQTDSEGVIRWGMEYSWRNIGERYPLEFETTNFIYNETTFSINSKNIHYTSIFNLDSDHNPVLIDYANHYPSSVFTARIFRDGLHVNDTYNSALGLLGIELIYEQCGFGQDNIFA
jgi:hypothetical protein